MYASQTFLLRSKKQVEIIMANYWTRLIGEKKVSESTGKTRFFIGSFQIFSVQRPWKVPMNNGGSQQNRPPVIYGRTLQIIALCLRRKLIRNRDFYGFPDSRFESMNWKVDLRGFYWFGEVIARDCWGFYGADLEGFGDTLGATNMQEFLCSRDPFGSPLKSRIFQPKLGGIVRESGYLFKDTRSPLFEHKQSGKRPNKTPNRPSQSWPPATQLKIKNLYTHQTFPCAKISIPSTSYPFCWISFFFVQ